MSAPDSVTEAHVLAYLTGKLPVAISELFAHGEYENGWLSELAAPPEPTLDSLALTWFGTA